MNLQQYLNDVIHKKQNGLYICQLPTGYGKSYATTQAIAELIRDASQKRKIIYLTTLIKNLPMEPLEKIFKSEADLYDKCVLQIRSNLEEVKEKLPDMEIPQLFQTESYENLLKQLNNLKRAEESQVRDSGYLEELKKRAREAESVFRHEITSHLRKQFPNKRARLAAIRKQKDYQWIGKLYPAVFTDTHKVLFMTVSKFLAKNSTLIEPSYDFLSSPMLKDAIIFIDEFDATKNVIQEYIIDQALELQNEYISLLRQLHHGLRPDNLSEPIRESGGFTAMTDNSRSLSLIEEGKKLIQQYHLLLSYKTTEDAVDRQQNFLFHDGSFHTILQPGKQYVRASLNETANRVDIFLESKEEYYQRHHAEKDISIYSMLRDIQRYLKRFRLFLYDWAETYREWENENRSEIRDEMTLEHALSTILNALHLAENQKKLLLGESCQQHIKRTKNQLPEQDFYSRGMEVFELEDHEEHNDATNLQYTCVYDTPEKIIRYLSEQATVFGISATADIGTVLGNYNLGYLRSRLGTLYHQTDEALLKHVKEEMETIWKPYAEGKVHIHTEVLPEYQENYDVTKLCRSFMNNAELAGIAAEHIISCTDKEYAIKRYCRLLNVMCAFCRQEDMQSILCLEMALPKSNNSEMKEELLKDLLAIAYEDAGRTEDENALVILRSDRFDEDKARLLEELEKGKKRFVMSTYATIGAGQNLQYAVTDKTDLIELIPCLTPDDKRHFTKDFDALYLGDITYLTVNTYAKRQLSRKELFQMLFQVEELYHNGELNYKTKDKMIKLAFRSRMQKENYVTNELYHAKSFHVRATQMVIQAVGRMCRTFLKKPDIYLFIDARLLGKLDVSEMQKRILPPEMDALVTLRKQQGTVYTHKEEYTLNIAERISTEGMWLIRRVLSRGWTEDSMALWEELRRLVLMYPTASETCHEAIDLIRTLYITSGLPQNRYLYSQYSDFNDVAIDFTSEEAAFRNSDRVKIKGESEDVAVWKMSEEVSGLPVILRYDGMKAFFERQGYATAFLPNLWMMSPVLFHNIYKGALGEAAGRFILERERGIKLYPISEPDKFEFFDFVMKPDVYVDFKNWKFTYTQDRAMIREEILQKLNKIGGKRVYVINMIQAPGSQYAESHDSRIIEIPGLLDENGSLIPGVIDHIRKEDYEV